MTPKNNFLVNFFRFSDSSKFSKPTRNCRRLRRDGKWEAANPTPKKETNFNHNLFLLSSNSVITWNQWILYVLVLDVVIDVIIICLIDLRAKNVGLNLFSQLSSVLNLVVFSRSLSLPSGILADIIGVPKYDCILAYFK